MAEIADLLQEVAQKARKCPTPTLVHAYRQAARKFCNQSKWLRRELEIATVAAEPQYDLVPDTGDAMLEVIGVRVLTVINPATENYRANPSDPMGWNPAMPPGAPQTWCYVPESEIAVFPTPDNVYTLVCTVECQPLVDAVELPDDLLRKWDQALSAGALAYLLNIHGQPWYDPRMARENAIAFQAEISNAKANVARAYNTGTVMARIRRLF
jgi:hypothetical protein